MTSRRRSNISNRSNFASDTESLKAKNLIYVIGKQSQLRLDDNLQILDATKIKKKHSLTADKEFDNNGLWSIGDQQETNERANDLLTARTSTDDDLERNEFPILKPTTTNKLDGNQELEYRSNQYLNKRLPWYCESSSPIKWFKQYSNDQLPKVNYDQKLIEQQMKTTIQKNDQPLINLDSNGYANLDFNNFDKNSIQTYTRSYPIKNSIKDDKITQPKDHLRFIDPQHQLQPHQYGINHSSIGTNSKPQSTKNYYQPFQFNIISDQQQQHQQQPFTTASRYQNQQQWRKLSLPHFQTHYHPNKYLGSSRSSYGGRRSHTNKNKFKLNPFTSFYKPRSSNYAGLNEMFADSSVPGVREICHSDGYFRKFIWMIAFVLFSFLALNDIQQLLSDFYSYPISVDMRMRESRKLPFPAVTICNLNIVRYSALCNSTLNVSMPVELQEKLCGTNLSQMKNTSIEDINDILPDSDQSQTTKPPFDDYLNYEDEIANEQTSGHPETTQHPKGKKGKSTRRPNNNTKTKKKSILKRSPPSATGPGKSHSQPDLSKASPSPPEFGSPEIEMFELTEREEKELQENLTTWLAVMANKNKNLTFTLGHQFDDLVLRCTIKSSNCTHPK